MTITTDNEIVRLYEFYVAEYEIAFLAAKDKSADAATKTRRSADLKDLLAEMVKNFGVDGMWDIIEIATDRANAR